MLEVLIRLVDGIMMSSTRNSISQHVEFSDPSPAILLDDGGKHENLTHHDI
jgi:hypothetical protein